MGAARLTEAVVVGIVATAAMATLIVAATSISSSKHAVTVDAKVVKDYPDYHWAAVFVPKPLADEGCRQVAKSTGDEKLRGRYGQVMVSDDRCARDMALPENQSIDLTHEQMVRWEEHLRIAHVQHARGVLVRPLVSGLRDEGGPDDQP